MFSDWDAKSKKISQEKRQKLWVSWFGWKINPVNKLGFLEDWESIWGHLKAERDWE